MSSFNLRRFLLSRFLASLGDQFMMFAVPLIILKYTGSVKWSALAFTIQWLPRLLFLPVAGQIADRVNVSRLFIIADGARALAATCAVFATQLQPQQVFWILSFMMAALSLLQSVVFIAMEATLPRQVPQDEIPKAQSMLQSSDQLSQLTGPALAGLVVGFFDIHAVLWMGAILFVASLVNSFRLPMMAPPAPTEGKIWDLFLESYLSGLKTIRREKILIQLMALTWIVNVIYGSLLVLSPAIVTQTLHGTEKTYSILQTLAAVATLIALTLAPKMVKKFGLPDLGATAMALLVGGALLAAWAPGLAPFMVGVAVVMTSDALFNVYIRSTRAAVIPKSVFGKVTGLVIMINNSSIPASGLMISALTPYFSHQTLLALMTGLGVFLSIAVLAIGKIQFKYSTLVPSIQPPLQRTEK